MTCLLYHMCVKTKAHGVFNNRKASVGQDVNDKEVLLRGVVECPKHPENQTPTVEGHTAESWAPGPGFLLFEHG